MTTSFEVRNIKRQILISVQYLVEAEKDVFWDKDTGYLNKSMEDSFQKRFPQKLEIAEELCAQRYNLWHALIDYPGANLIKCPICKRLLTDTAKPRPIFHLDGAKELEGVMMCSSCAWEMGFDIQNGRSIESILEKFT